MGTFIDVHRQHILQDLAGALRQCERGLIADCAPSPCDTYTPYPTPIGNDPCDEWEMDDDDYAYES